MKKLALFLAIIIIPTLVFSQGEMVFDRAADIVSTVYGNLSSTNVQSALEELDDEKEPVLTTDSVNTDDINWDSVINMEIQTAGINWTSLDEDIQSGGINWTAIDDEIQRNSINWDSLIDDIGDFGINWGTGTGQVSGSDLPDEDLGEIGVSSGAWTVESTHSGSAHHAAVTVTDSETIDFTLSTQNITADAISTLTAPTGVLFGTVGTPVNQEYDIDGTTWVTSTDGTPNVANHLTADVLVAMDTAYDDEYFAVRETNGNASETEPLTVQFNFTGVTTFSSVKIRGHYVGSFSHFLYVELYNGVTWDILASLPNEINFEVHTYEILNPADYIAGGVVNLRMRHIQNGITSHHYLIDYLVLSTSQSGGGGGVQAAIQTPSTATGNIEAINVQAAIEELESEKEGTLTNSAGLLAALDDETGTGLAVFNIAPTFETSITGNYATASEILITGASKEIISAAVATYPSLTELSYVKGLSSAVQTQINAKAPSTAPTFVTSITTNYLTASEMVISGASKEIISAAVAIYPSLAELAYVKGVTSAIQTQLDAEKHQICFFIDGGGSAVTTGAKAWVRATNSFTIGGAEITSDTSTSSSVDIWLDSYANYPPIDADSICDAGTCPTLTTAVKAQDVTLTSWTTTVTAEDYIRANVDSNDNATLLEVCIYE